MKSKYIILSLMFVAIISLGCVSAEENVTADDSSISDSYDINPDVYYVYGESVDSSIQIAGYSEGYLANDTEVKITYSGVAYGDSDYKVYDTKFTRSGEDGNFNYTYMPTTGGQYDVNVTIGSNYSDSVSFYIGPKRTIVTLDPFEQITVGDSFDITGRLTDVDGNALRWTSVGVLLSGVPYGENSWNKVNYSKEYVRTDADGNYRYTITPELAGKLDICVYYPGYHYYAFSRVDTSRTILAHPTMITMNENLVTINDSNVINHTFSGRLTADGKPLRYTSVGIEFKIVPNRGMYSEIYGVRGTYLRTDGEGYFNYTLTFDELTTGSENFAYRSDLIKHSYVYDYIMTFYYPGYHNYRFNSSVVNCSVNFLNISDECLGYVDFENITFNVDEDELTADLDIYYIDQNYSKYFDTVASSLRLGSLPLNYLGDSNAIGYVVDLNFDDSSTLKLSYHLISDNFYTSEYSYPRVYTFVVPDVIFGKCGNYLKCIGEDIQLLMQFKDKSMLTYYGWMPGIYSVESLNPSVKINPLTELYPVNYTDFTDFLNDTPINVGYIDCENPIAIDYNEYNIIINVPLSLYDDSYSSKLSNLGDSAFFYFDSAYGLFLKGNEERLCGQIYTLYDNDSVNIRIPYLLINSDEIPLNYAQYELRLPTDYKVVFDNYDEDIYFDIKGDFIDLGISFYKYSEEAEYNKYRVKEAKLIK